MIAMPELLATGRRPAATHLLRAGALVSGFAAPDAIRPATTARIDTPTEPHVRSAGLLISAPGRPADEHPAVAPSGRLLPAPPPVSIQRTTEHHLATGSRAPAVPSSLPLVRGPDGTLRRSIVETTADLFRETSSMQAQSQNAGDEMPEHIRRLSVVRDGTPAQPDTTDQSVLDDPRKLDELVDKVVDKIERRVVDELERRGRRFSPGVF